MIIPREVQYAMEYENLDLVGDGMPQSTAISGGKVKGNGDVTAETFYKTGWRKGKHVSGVVLAAELRVQLPHAATAG